MSKNLFNRLTTVKQPEKSMKLTNAKETDRIYKMTMWLLNAEVLFI